jgi:hypothetical protein
MSDIDWTTGNSQVTEHFTVNDCLMLHSWNRLATEEDGADFDKLLILCQKLEEVRDALGSPMNVHCIFRSQDYNKSQSIQPIADVHSMNLAADFDCNDTMSIQDIKDKLVPLLEQLGIRLEFGTTTWCHVDLREPGPSGRYFHV